MNLIVNATGQNNFTTKIDLDDDGTVKVAAVDQKATEVAIEWIRNITAEPEIGAIYTGKVVKTVDFGAFVNFFGPKDGLVHISQLASERVQKTTDVGKEGQKVFVKLMGFDERGKVRLSMKVVDQETGEDITKVALSQILVDSERSNSDVSGSVLSQILGRGGDALYEALRKNFDDASENLGDFQDRFRRFVAGEDDGDGDSAAADGRDPRKLRDWIAYAAPDFEQIVQKSMERVFKLLDLPRRSDIEALNRNLERVAEAVDNLESARRPTDRWH
mgnify:CR=1 FL=1